MLEISELKEKKLPELQEIAKGLKIPRFSSLKKLDLIYQILDVQAAKPSDNQKEAPAKAKNPKTEHSAKALAEDEAEKNDETIYRGRPKRSHNFEPQYRFEQDSFIESEVNESTFS